MLWLQVVCIDDVVCGDGVGRRDLMDDRTRVDILVGLHRKGEHTFSICEVARSLYVPLAIAAKPPPSCYSRGRTAAPSGYEQAIRRAVDGGCLSKVRHHSR
eukprot:6481882-Amphidinium_carterae.2